jgi:predicted RNA-binding protein with PUA-like domain
MAYWLLKSEPDAWSWTEQVAKGRDGAEWTGIRNFAAAMVGDSGKLE